MVGGARPEASFVQDNPHDERIEAHVELSHLGRWWVPFGRAGGVVSRQERCVVFGGRLGR